jgi:hypothetical protein
MVFSGSNVFLYPPEGQGATELPPELCRRLRQPRQLIEQRFRPFQPRPGVGQSRITTAFDPDASSSYRHAR